MTSTRDLHGLPSAHSDLNAKETSTEAKLREAMRALLLPPIELARRSSAAAGKPEPPPWLDDDLMAIAAALGFTRDVPMVGRPSPGTLIGTDQQGNLWRTELTDEGRAFACAEWSPRDDTN